jgi:hypothetical protein
MAYGLDTPELKLAAGDVLTEEHIKIIAAMYERGVLLANAARNRAGSIQGELSALRNDVAHIEAVYGDRVLDAKGEV